MLTLSHPKQIQEAKRDGENADAFGNLVKRVTVPFSCLGLNIFVIKALNKKVLGNH